MAVQYATKTDERLGRVTGMLGALRRLVSYRYFGAGSVYGVKVTGMSEYPDIRGETDWRTRLESRLDGWDPNAIYKNLDNLGHVTAQDWTRGRMGRIYDSVAYRHTVHGLRVGRRPFDETRYSEAYDYDRLDRLRDVVRGSGAIQPGEMVSDGETFYQRWLCDPTGNAYDFWQMERNAQGSWTTTADQQRKFNRANQVVAIRDTTGGNWAVPRYDRAGNAVVIPQPKSPTQKYYCTYDGWNRLVKVETRAGTTRRPVAEYTYDGLGRRVVTKRFDAGGALSEQRHFYYSTAWQVLEEWLRTDLGSTKPGWQLDRWYAWGVRGPNDLVMRERTVSGQKERIFPLADPAGNVTSLVGTSMVEGAPRSDVLERYHYDPYGRPYFLDRESNVRESGESRYDWNILYGGYEYEPATGLYHVRHRIYHPTLGLWLQPDPQGYADGVNLYQYVRSSPLSFTDPSGLVRAPGFWESLIPIWGSGRQMLNDFEEGRWVWGLVNLAFAVSDVFLVKTLLSIPFKLGRRLLLRQASRESAEKVAAQLEKNCVQELAEHVGTQGARAVGRGGASRARTIYTVTEDFTAITSGGKGLAGEFFSHTEGTIFGMATRGAGSWRTWMRASRDVGTMIWQGKAASLFKPIAVEGWYTGAKRLLGQYTTAMGKIRWGKNALAVVGREAVVSRAGLKPLRGMELAVALAGVWGRRLAIEYGIPHAALFRHAWDLDTLAEAKRQEIENAKPLIPSGTPGDISP